MVQRVINGDITFSEIYCANYQQNYLSASRVCVSIKLIFSLGLCDLNICAIPPLVSAQVTTRAERCAQ